jgi:hypothetical protein
VPDVDYSCDAQSNVLTFLTSNSYPIEDLDDEAIGSNHAIAIAAGQTVTLDVLNNLDIEPDPTLNGGLDLSGIDVAGASTLTLNLANGTQSLVRPKTNPSGYSRVAAVHVPVGATLYIEGDGEITATRIVRNANSEGGAGIGSNLAENAGYIEFRGNATVNATANGPGAGIGGGARGAANTICSSSAGNGGTTKILGNASVNARGIYSGAGIGGGGIRCGANSGADGGTILIDTQGTVTSYSTGGTDTGDNGAAAIGGSSQNAGATLAGKYDITINNGTVIATTGKNGASIGGGSNGENLIGSTVTINGGVIIAPNRIGAANNRSSTANNARVIITGGNVFQGNTPSPYSQPTSDGEIPAAANSLYPVYVPNAIPSSGGDSTIGGVIATNTQPNYTANLVDLTLPTYGSATTNPISGVIWLNGSVDGEVYQDISITPALGSTMNDLQAYVINENKTYANASQSQSNIVDELYLSLTVSGTGSIDIGSLIPGGGDSTAWRAASVDATVTTNSGAGWSLSFNATNDSMVCEDNVSYTIPSVSTEDPKLPDHSWGWGVFNSPTPPPTASSKFNPVAVGNNQITDSTSPTSLSGNTTSLYFAARAGMQTVACSYKNTVVITAVAGL